MRVVCCLVSLCLAASLNAEAFQASEGAANKSEAERQELQSAIQDAGPSAPDFVRALEKHLAKYPATNRKHEIVKALYQGSRELQDSRRIALYGEQLIAVTPDDANLLAAVGEALNTFNDRVSAAKALTYGMRLEKAFADASKTDKAAKMKAGAMLIEADASGILDKTADAIKFAASSYELAPSAVAARSLGRWSAKAGNFEQAVDAYATAFAIPDSDQEQNEDRRKIEEYYRKTHASNVGLGDVVLRAYDRAALKVKQAGDSSPDRPTDIKLSGVDGDTLSMASLKGKVVVMDFWATWCGPCRTQHPLYEQVKQRFEKNGQVVFLQINSDDDRSAVAPFLTEQRWNRQVYFDDGLGEAYKVKNIPTTVLLDQRGNLYSKMIGFRPDAFVEQLTSRINEALQVQN